MPHPGKTIILRIQQQTTNKTDEQTTNSQEESLENVPSDSKTGSLKNHLSYKSKRMFECRCLLLKILITARLIWSSFTVKHTNGHGMVKPLPSHEKLIYRKIYENFFSHHNFNLFQIRGEILCLTRHFEGNRPILHLFFS